MRKFALAESGVLCHLTLPDPGTEIQQRVFTGYVLRMKSLRAHWYYITSWLCFRQWQWVFFKTMVGCCCCRWLTPSIPFCMQQVWNIVLSNIYNSFTPNQPQPPLCHTPCPATHTFSFRLYQHHSAGLHFQHFRYFALPKHTQRRIILSECHWGGTWRPAECCVEWLWSFCSAEGYMEQGSFSGPS